MKNPDLAAVKEKNHPLARGFLSNHFFTEVSPFGDANKTSLAIAARFTDPEEFEMRVKKVKPLSPLEQAAEMRKVAFSKQIAHMENINLIIQSPDFAERIKYFKILNADLESKIQSHEITEEYLRPLTGPLTSKDPPIIDFVLNKQPKLIENTAFDSDAVNDSIMDIYYPSETPTPAPPPTAPK